MEFRLTYKTHIGLILAGFLFTVIFFNPLSSTLLEFFLNIGEYSPQTYEILYIYIYLFLVMMLITVVHELLHGSMYKLFGGKVKYSFKIIYAATQEVSSLALPINKFIIVLLAPVTVISIGCLLLPSWIGSLIFIMNFLGSFGDIYMAIGLLKHPSTSKVIDTSYGYKLV